MAKSISDNIKEVKGAKHETLEDMAVKCSKLYCNKWAY